MPTSPHTHMNSVISKCIYNNYIYWYTYTYIHKYIENNIIWYIQAYIHTYTWYYSKYSTEKANKNIKKIAKDNCKLKIQILFYSTTKKIKIFENFIINYIKNYKILTCIHRTYNIHKYTYVPYILTLYYELFK